MSLTVRVAPPSNLLTTLVRAKGVLGIAGDDTSSDGDLNDLIRDASTAITTECGRKYFGMATYVETLPGTGSQQLSLSHVPVLTISQILQDTEVLTSIDPTNPSVPNAAEGYYIEDADAGAIYRACGWGRSVGLLSWGHEAYASGYILSGSTALQRYTVTYTAGYFLPGQVLPALDNPVTGFEGLYDPTSPSDAPRLPGALEQACLETIKAWWFARGRDPSVTNAQVDQNLRVAYAPTQVGSLPPVAMGLIRNHRRVN